MDLTNLVIALLPARWTSWTARLLAVVVLATICFLAAGRLPAGASQPAPQRYLDKVFDRATVTKDVRYAPTPPGSAVERLGDVYEPEGDTAARRPAVVWLHGSGADKSGVVENYVATMFARHGAVAVSIDYRARAFRTDGSYDNLPVEDATAALAWLRAHADEYRIDPARLVLAGASAGGMAALDTAYLGHDDGLAAVLSIVGTGPEDGARGDGPPTLMINGDADQIVRLERATRFCDEVNRAGGSCTLQPFPSGHAIYGFATEIEQVVSDWFWRILDFGSLTGTPGPPVTTPTTRLPTSTVPSTFPRPGPSDTFPVLPDPVPAPVPDPEPVPVPVPVPTTVVPSGPVPATTTLNTPAPTALVAPVPAPTDAPGDTPAGGLPLTALVAAGLVLLGGVGVGSARRRR